jgi:arabinofuranosyltransferase
MVRALRVVSRRTWIAAFVTLPFVLLLLHNARPYLPFISDDALISLRYADRLLDGKGLTWNDGERVEGYSNFLWILLVAAAGGTGADLIAAARALGLFCSAGLLFAIAWGSLRRASVSHVVGAVVALSFAASAAPIVVWSIGGLEQPLYGALLAAATALTISVLDRPPADRGGRLPLAIALGLLCLTRPDGALFAAVAIVSLLVARRWSWSTLLVPIGLYVAQLAFRRAYYGEWVPNTALVKIAPSLDHFKAGWDYVAAGFSALLPFSGFAALSLAAALLVRERRARGLHLCATALAWSAYVVFIGGDIFPAYRHLVPLVVVFAFALADGAAAAAGRLQRKPVYLVIAGVLWLALWVPFAARQHSDKQSQRAMRERWEWDCRELALQLKRAFERQRPLVAVTAAGCLPYWSELPSLDMLGLNDYYLPRHPPPDVGRGMIGHELGDGRYVFDRQPDLIVFNVGSPPFYRSGEELQRMPEFHQRYAPVALSLPPAGDPALVYVNKDSGEAGIGIARGPSSVSIPGWIFTSPDARALPSSDGVLALMLAPQQQARVSFQSAERLTGWTLDVAASPYGSVEGAIEQADTTVTVTIRNGGAAATQVSEVVLRRR